MEELLFYTVDKNHKKNEPLAIIEFLAMIPVSDKINVISVLNYNK